MTSGKAKPVIAKRGGIGPAKAGPAVVVGVTAVRAWLSSPSGPPPPPGWYTT